jgi:hypothetical protein
MGVSKYSKNGLEYLRANFTVHGKATVIEGQIALNDNNYIWYEGFRSANVAGEKTYFSANVLVADYFKDIGYLLKYLDANPFKLDSLYQGLFEQITNHIKEYGRIIDEDLHTYLDYFIIAQNFLSFSHGLKFYNKEEGEKLFNETKDICYKYFADYVWISVPDQFLNFKLVKLKDLIEQQDDKDGTTEKLDSSILKELGTSNGKRIVIMIEMLDDMHFPEETFKSKEIREMRNGEIKIYRSFYGDLALTDYRIKITNRSSKYPVIEDTESDFELIIERENNTLTAKYFSFELDNGFKFQIKGFKFFGNNM